MPYYEFECKKCGELFDIKQSFEEHDRHPKVKCPKCGSEKVEQHLAPVTVITPKKS